MWTVTPSDSLTPDQYRRPRGLPNLLLALSLTLLLGLAGCAADSSSGGSGGDTSGTAGTGDSASSDWTLTGTVTDSSLAGGEVLALDTDGQVTRADVGSDGSLSVGLAGGRSYAVNFLKDDVFVATLFFQRNSSNGAMTSVLALPIVSAQSSLTRDTGGEIGLGDVEIENGQALPENSPTQYFDSDGDGSDDFDDDDDDNDGIPDLSETEDTIDTSTLGFIVASLEPRPDEDGVDTDEKVEVHFSQAADPDTITSSTLTLTDSANAAVAGTIEVDDDGTEVKFRPTDLLTAGETYTVTVTTGVLSTSGDALAAAFQSSFTVSSGDDDDDDSDDSSVFAIDEIDPGDGDTGVDRDETIKVEFTSSLDAGTVVVSASGFQLLDSEDAAVAGTLTVDGDELRFTPDEDLTASSTYTISIGTGIESGSGATLSSAVSTTFTTGTSTGGGDDDGEEEED